MPASHGRRASRPGALPPAAPAWCSPLAQGDPTFVEGPDSWLDDFDHGLTNATLGDGYQVFERAGPSINKALHFRHNDHWMVDVNGVDADGGGPWNFGGALMRRIGRSASRTAS